MAVVLVKVCVLKYLLTQFSNLETKGERNSLYDGITHPSLK